MSREWVDVRVVTYNIHRARGLDRRTRPERIARVLDAIAPDIVALQEVVGPGLQGEGQAAEIGAALGMGAVMAPTREVRRHAFGNAVLSRFPVREHTQLDLSWKTCEPRNAQRVDLDLGGGRLMHIFNVHLGTALLERRHQAPKLASWVHDRRIPGPKLVVGDFNEWGADWWRTCSPRACRVSICSSSSNAGARIRDFSRSCTSITFILSETSRSAAWPCRAHGCHSSRRITCRWSQIFG
jgi:endonuclease/exonuclease/phosphatase family metal-dependent hydrolase